MAMGPPQGMMGVTDVSMPVPQASGHTSPLSSTLH
eukprot:CAMPEP_0202358556 /NCGR_PEP_ID=MMETSP1126-20121109/12182_1 /ASSEMBLY_ACC=CAM_ASM_000457 /TAXON_ID=3047 /ORGANISM="Dunaliella tertiolecta, Strain CCMP1320" /LENGTH=34 /DNA_ID= /DNA_START= /DNA_END= /DNA_ORIENTATION=